MRFVDAIFVGKNGAMRFRCDYHPCS